MVKCGLDEGFRWWCGNFEDTPTCANGTNGTQFEWQSATAVRLAGDAMPSTATGDSSATSTGASSATSSPSDSAPSSSPSCSPSSKNDNTGSTVAVGLGVGLPLLVLAAALGWMLFRERRKPRWSGDTSHQDEKYTLQSETPVTGKPENVEAHWLVHELNGQDSRSELNHGK
ncbi:MAG: hypothetical protein Q9227_006660 [Pyrenula ochraceoflavens]